MSVAAASANRGQVAPRILSAMAQSPASVAPPERDGSPARVKAPITLRALPADAFVAMEAKVGRLELAEAPLTDKERSALAAGKTLKTSKSLGGGVVEEYTRGVVPVPIERFLRTIPAKDWGKNLVDWKGGAVRPAGPGRQIERMVLAAPGKDLDMTKVETVREIRDSRGGLQGARVRWEVLHSDNGSVAKDVGLVRFERFGNGTLVTWHSAHELRTAPFSWNILPQGLRDKLLGWSLTSYFGRAIDHYRKTAEGGTREQAAGGS